MGDRLLGARVEIRVYDHPSFPRTLRGVVIELGRIDEGVTLKQGAVLYPRILHVHLNEPIALDGQLKRLVVVVWYEEEFNRLETQGLTKGVSCSLFVGKELNSVESVSSFEHLLEVAKDADVEITDSR